MAEPDLDFDTIMQRIRDELEPSHVPAPEPSTPASADRNRVAALFRENTPQFATEPKPKRTWARRLSLRKLFHRILGLREVARLERVLRGLRRNGLPVSAIPAAVNALQSSVASLKTAVMGVAATSVDRSEFDALRREFDELRRRTLGDNIEARLASVRDQAAAGRQLVIEANRKAAELSRHVDDLSAKHSALEVRLSDTHPALKDMEELAVKHDALEAQVSKSDALLQLASTVAGKCEGILDDHERRLWAAKAIVDKLDRKILDHWRHISDQNRRLSLLVSDIRRRAEGGLAPSQLASLEKAVDQQLSALYVTFEDVYRGTRGEIMERQKVYLPRVQQAVEAAKAGLVVDLGCGRGEFLELLRAEGIRALGVDQNGVMVSECRDMGLETIEGDVIGYLREQQSASLSALTSFHVVEHLPYRTLIEFLDDAFRVIAPGGVLILETPNPANLVVAAERFHMDPTHVKPLPSELLSFLAEARGFVDVEVMPLHPVAAPHVQYDDELMRFLQDKIYGPQDYGLIARKAS